MKPDFSPKKHFQFFCPQCRAERKLSANPKIEPRHAFQIALTTAILTLFTWPWLGWNGWVLFVPIWATFEIIFRTRNRIALACPYCGFDPFLYVQDVKKARAEMERFWRTKYQEKGLTYPGDPLAAAQPQAVAPKAQSSTPLKPNDPTQA